MTSVSVLFCHAETISEHSFSAMQRLKTYLHSTMGQRRLNAIMLLHVHKEMTDKLSVIDLANTFTNIEHRQSVLVLFQKGTCRNLGLSWKIILFSW